MARSIEVMLGETAYLVPQLEIDQYEELMQLWEDDKAIDAGNSAARFKSSISAVAIMLRYSSPAIENIRKLRCTLAELAAARAAILSAAGLVAAPETANGAAMGEGEAAAGAASISTSSLPN